MTVPFVAALSASCSTKPTVAPRPASREGSSAARVTAGFGAGAFAGAVPAKAEPPRVMLSAIAVAATVAVFNVTGFPVPLNTAAAFDIFVLLRDIEYSPLSGTPEDAR